MRRSSRISLGLVPIVSAAFLAGCSAPQQKACIDQTNHVVADVNCPAPPPAGSSGSWNTSSVGGFYRWYWFRGSRSPFIGGLVPTGGQFTAPVARASSGTVGSHPASATTRGGFGSTASGHSGGGT